MWTVLVQEAESAASVRCLLLGCKAELLLPSVCFSPTWDFHKTLQTHSWCKICLNSTSSLGICSCAIHAPGAVSEALYTGIWHSLVGGWQLWQGMHLHSEYPLPLSTGMDRHRVCSPAPLKKWVVFVACRLALFCLLYHQYLHIW